MPLTLEQVQAEARAKVQHHPPPDHHGMGQFYDSIQYDKPPDEKSLAAAKREAEEAEREAEAD